MLRSVKTFHRIWAGAATVAALVLSGCAGPRTLDSEVLAFSRLEQLPAEREWRFERLPSQQNLSPVLAQRQQALEALVSAELAKLGFAAKPVETGSAKWIVQTRSQLLGIDHGLRVDPWWHGGVRFPWRHGIFALEGPYLHVPLVPIMAPAWQVRELSVVIRDATSAAVVYETTARHEGYATDAQAVWPGMLAAAFKDFPKPPAGQRLVSIELPR